MNWGSWRTSTREKFRHDNFSVSACFLWIISWRYWNKFQNVNKDIMTQQRACILKALKTFSKISINTLNSENKQIDSYQNYAKRFLHSIGKPQAICLMTWYVKKFKQVYFLEYFKPLIYIVSFRMFYFLFNWASVQ